MYNVGTNIYENMLSVITGEAITNPANRNKLIEKVKWMFADLSKNGITQDELDFCKAAIAASEDLSSAPNIVHFYQCAKIKKYH